jgi:hypothetical protein
MKRNRPDIWIISTVLFLFLLITFIFIGKSASVPVPGPNGLVPLAQVGAAFQCQVAAVSVTTKCTGTTPGALKRWYVTDFVLTNNVGTAQTIGISYGTGSNCATGTTVMLQPVQFGAAVGNFGQSLQTPLAAALATDVCIVPSAATSFSGTLTGFQAP